MQLTFLGCSDEHGVPRAGCECQVCQGILSSDNPNYRTGPSVALRYGPAYAERNVLIDVAPEFRLQANHLGLRLFDALLLTHAHDVHILGLSVLANAQREAGQTVTVHAPAHVLDEVRQRFPLLWTDKSYRRAVQFQTLDGPLDLWGLQARPLRLDHGRGGVAYGYVLTLDAARAAYLPDMLRPTAEIREALTALDLLVLGAEHYYEGIETWRRSVMDVMAALELIREVTPGRAILTHLSHTIDYEEVTGQLPPGVSLAHDGLAVEVQA